MSCALGVLAALQVDLKLKGGTGSLLLAGTPFIPGRQHGEEGKKSSGAFGECDVAKAKAKKHQCGGRTSKPSQPTCPSSGNSK